MRKDPPLVAVRIEPVALTSNDLIATFRPIRVEADVPVAIPLTNEAPTNVLTLGVRLKVESTSINLLSPDVVGLAQPPVRMACAAVLAEGGADFFIYEARLEDDPDMYEERRESVPIFGFALYLRLTGPLNTIIDFVFFILFLKVGYLSQFLGDSHCGVEILRLSRQLDQEKEEH